MSYTGKDDNRGIYQKNDSPPYFFRRNRDLGTISVYVGYRDVRCLPPPCVHIWLEHIFVR